MTICYLFGGFSSFLVFFFFGEEVGGCLYFLFSPLEFQDENLVLKMLFMARNIISGSAMKIKVLLMLCQKHFLEEAYKYKCPEESSEGGRMFSVFPFLCFKEMKKKETKVFIVIQ